MKHRLIALFLAASALNGCATLLSPARCERALTGLQTASDIAADTICSSRTGCQDGSKLSPAPSSRASLARRRTDLEIWRPSSQATKPPIASMTVPPSTKSRMVRNIGRSMMPLWAQSTARQPLNCDRLEINS